MAPVQWFLHRIIYTNFNSPLTYVDLLVAALCVFIALYYLRRFPVYRAMAGIVVLLLAAAVALSLHLVFTALLFLIVGGVILIDVPVIFAPEVRHYLEKLGYLPFRQMRKIGSRQRNEEFVGQLAEALFAMADRKIGALVVLERHTSLIATIETGELIDAQFSRRLLQNLFYPKSPLHDGAVVISSQRIVAAGCLLPITSDVKLPGRAGTRHRSGVAVTRDTDAVTVIVSEERGEVSMAENGRLRWDLSRAELIDALLKLLSE